MRRVVLPVVAVLALAGPAWADTIETVAVSANGKVAAACGGDRNVWFWELPSGRLIHEVQTGELRPDVVGLAPDGKTAAVGAQKADGTILLYEVATGKATHTAKIGDYPATTLAYTKDGKHLLAGGMSGLLTLYKADTLEVVRDYRDKIESNVHWVAFAPDEKTFAAANVDKAVRIYETATGKLLQTFKEHEDWVDRVAFADAKTVVSVDHSGTIRVWDPATAKETAKLVGEDYWTNATALSSDGKTLAWAGKDGAVHVADRATLKETGLVPGKDNVVKDLAFTPDGKHLVVGDTAGVVQLVDLASRTGKVIREKK